MDHASADVQIGAFVRHRVCNDDIESREHRFDLYVATIVQNRRRAVELLGNDLTAQGGRCFFRVQNGNALASDSLGN